MAVLSFEQPLFLWLLLLLPLLIASHFYFLQRTQKKALKFANFEAIKRIKGEKFVTKNITLLVIRVLIVFLFIIGLAQTTYFYEGPRNNFDYVLAIDTSASMLAEDIEPTRLEGAKSAAISFIDTINTDTRIGFIDFSGVTYMRNQLSRDTLPARIAIQQTNVSRVSGTDISNAIITATNSFTGDEDTGRALIIFTDGVDTVGAYIDDNIIRATEYAVSEQVVIHTIGFGTDDAPLGYLPESFNLTSSIDRDALIYMANETGGSFAFPSTTEELNSYFDTFNDRFQIAQIPLPLYRYSFVLALLLLAIEWIAFNFVFRRVA